MDSREERDSRADVVLVDLTLRPQKHLSDDLFVFKESSQDSVHFVSSDARVERALSLPADAKRGAARRPPPQRSSEALR
jgi:hypothetical protein